MAKKRSMEIATSVHTVTVTETAETEKETDCPIWAHPGVIDTAADWATMRFIYHWQPSFIRMLGNIEDANFPDGMKWENAFSAIRAIHIACCAAVIISPYVFVGRSITFCWKPHALAQQLVTATQRAGFLEGWQPINNSMVLRNKTMT